MLRISKLADYGILVMVELVKARGEVLSAQALAERSHIELPTASKVLKLLTGNDLVVSYRGPAGGYAFELDAGETSVAAVIAAIEGPIAMTECSIHEGLCSVEASCNARENWQKISRAVAGALEEISLSEMAGTVIAGKKPGMDRQIEITTLNA